MTQPASSPGRSRYDGIARVYDLLGAAYTLGGIGRAKLAHTSLIQPGSSVLYVGAGTGSECVHAAQRGAHVTVVEQSSSMLNICQNRLAKAKLKATLIQGDALQSSTFRAEQTFDCVVAPFFLNVVGVTELPAAMETLTQRLHSGGQLMSVDFRAPHANFLFRQIQQLYYLPPLALFYVLTQNPWHSLYDYRKITRDAQLPLTLTNEHAHTAWGLPLLQTLIWKKH